MIESSQWLKKWFRITIAICSAIGLLSFLVGTMANAATLPPVKPWQPSTPTQVRTIAPSMSAHTATQPKSGFLLTDTIITAMSNDISADWSISTIDNVDLGYYVHSSYTAIAVDNEDKVHISYRGPDSNLRYATNKHGSWFAEVVYTASVRVARESSIAVDSNNHPHISFSYRDGNNENLMYAKNITGTWVIATIDSEASVGMENDIAVDSNDNTHTSHWQWNGSDLRYSTNKSNEWRTEEIADQAVWNRTSIAVDSDDNVTIVYRGYFPVGIYYATN